MKSTPDMPEPSSLLAQAKEQPAGYAPATGGVGRRYIEIVALLREEKNWTFPDITAWLAERGVKLSQYGWRSAYDVYKGRRKK